MSLSEIPTWESRGLMLHQSRGRKISPTPTEFALGIFTVEIDPLIRDAIVHLAESGYNPQDSCQGHYQGDTGHISLGISLPSQAYNLINFAGLGIEPSEGYDPRSRYNPYVRILLPHNNLTPEEFQRKILALVQALPRIGDIVYNVDFPAQDFRCKYGFEGVIPPDRTSTRLNPVFEQEVQTPLFPLKNLIFSRV